MWTIAGKILYWALVARATFVTVGLLLFDIPRLFIASKVYRKLPVRVMKKMLVYSFSSKNALSVTNVVAIALAGIVACYVSWAPAILIIVITVLSSLSVLCKLAIPPTILLLSISSSRSLDLLATMDKTLYPLRTIYLLDAESTGSTQVATRGRQRFELNNIRRYERMDWQFLVKEIAAFVPNIVADARSFSPAIHNEMSHILSSRTLIEKTIVITNVDGSAPGIKDLGSNAPSSLGIVHCKPEELMRLLAERGVKGLQAGVDAVRAETGFTIFTRK